MWNLRNYFFFNISQGFIQNYLGILVNTTEFASLNSIFLSRLTQLQAFIEEDPSDPFNHYALAMELTRTDKGAGITKFREVMDNFPSYQPTYYILCKLLSESGLSKEALVVATRGLSLATEKGDKKAWSELNALREEIEW